MQHLPSPRVLARFREGRDLTSAAQRTGTKCSLCRFSDNKLFHMATPKLCSVKTGVTLGLCLDGCEE